MFENPLVSFFSMLIVTSFIGFGISLFFYKTGPVKRVLISPVIGYAIISLTTAYLSYAGLATNKMATPLFLILVLAAIIAIVRKRKKILDDKELSFKFLIPIILFGLANTAIVLAPTVLENAPYLFNDHTTYISISEYLRDFGYSVPTQKEITFWHDNTWQYQSMHLRMGAQFFTSFFAALLQTTHTISIYPSILGLTAFTLMCSISFLYLSFRKEKSNIIEGIFVLFFYLIAINLNSQNLALGFLPQTLGIITFITLASLIYDTFYSNKKPFVLIGLLFASLVLTYHEITLFYGIGIFILLIFEYFYKKNRNNRLFIKIILVHILALLLSPIATKEFILGIYSSSKTNGVGWDVPYSIIRYFQALLGQDIHYILPNNKERLLTIPGLYASFIFLYLLLRKRFWEENKEILKFLICIFSPFVIAIGIYAYLINNPFTNQVGHTWNIFKLISWSFWIFPTITGIAVFSYFKETFSKKLLTITLCLLLLPSVGENIYANYLNHKYEIELYTNNYNDPLKDFEYLAKNKKIYSPANLINYQSHPNYPYLTFSILKDMSVGDLNILGNQLTPSIDTDFYNWINYRREHANTERPLITKAGFIIYPKTSSTVYLFDGFSQREIYDNDHSAWLASKTGTIKVIVPKNQKAQFTTNISNWQNKTVKIEIVFNNKAIFTSNVTGGSTQFTSPILREGNHKFIINYNGELRTPDSNDGRTLGLMFKNTHIVLIK